MTSRITHSFAVGAAALTLATTLASCGKVKSSSTPPKAAAPAAGLDAGIVTKVTREVAEILGVDASKIGPDKDLIRDLGADSLDAVEIVMAVEEEFNITIDDASAEKMRTVADIARYVAAKTRK
ncbi:acyl carrier protein [Prosthecobacter sp.]|uniref:acyl carrier protein n=1 Tax=Prosthecobacter sp. TaxID=1965333 RepID=UPI003783D7A2